MKIRWIFFRWKHLAVLFIAFTLIFLSAGCNEKKAEAIKLAAEKFRIESITAIENIKNLFRKSISMPFEENDVEIERIANNLNDEKIGPQELAFLISERDIGRNTQIMVNTEFEEIEKTYYQFESMFRSLQRGSFFAKDAVRKSEKHAISLTVQMINFANFLKNYPVQFTGRRTLIIENIANAKLVENNSLKMEYLRIVAKDIIQLRNDENQAKHEAILQCLKAAEAGKLVADLIRNYQSLNVGDLLASTKNALNFIANISEGSLNLDSLLEKYETVVTTIKNDPYWKMILDEKLLQ